MFFCGPAILSWLAIALAPRWETLLTEIMFAFKVLIL